MAKPPPSRLGRGLGALFTPSDTPAGDAELVHQLPVGAITPNPYQPRRSFDRDALDELTASIKLHGLMQPIVVAPAAQADQYVLIAGERRWRAAHLAGFETIPALLRDAGDQQRLELALIENLQRADLNAMECAHAFRRLADEFALTQEQIAQRAGRSRAAVANALRLLGLPREVQDAVAGGALTEGHARALLGLPDGAAVQAIAADVIARGLSVRQTEALVRAYKPDAAARPRGSRLAAADPDTVALESAMREALGTRVRLARTQRGAGTVTIAFASEEELAAIYTVITSGTQRP